jgi:osmoprotectant transport system ATP-binding protein
VLNAGLLPHGIIELHNCWKAYGSVQALSSIHLQIPAEKTVVLIGPSGCGKSTLLRLIIGLVRPDQGEIHFEGSEMHLQEMLKIRHQMGYVIQNGGLFPHLTARLNVTLMARHLEWKKSEIEGRLLELAELTQFPPDGLERYPVQLSGGQKQRVALMRALMLDPKVLLLDEPLGALDPIIRFELQTDLKRIFQKLHKTVVLVTHDLDEAEYFGDSIVLMREGQIVQQGSVQEMVNAPVDPFVTRFIHAQRRHEGVSV